MRRLQEHDEVPAYNDLLINHLETETNVDYTKVPEAMNVYLGGFL